MKAFVWRTGLVNFAEVTPEGALEVGTGPDDLLKAVVGEVSRLAYNNEDLICPGVPEAGEDGDAAVDAVLAFRDAITMRIKRYLADPAAAAEFLAS